MTKEQENVHEATDIIAINQSISEILVRRHELRVAIDAIVFDLEPNA